MPKIVRFHETGGPEVLQLEDFPLAEPDKGEVRLKVEAIGLNRAEIMFRKGQYLEAPQLPSRLGYEAAGIIDAVGPEVTDLQIGDRVSTIPSFPMGQYGVYGESAIVPAYAAAHYPNTLSVIEGAAVWMQYMTAYGALIQYGNIQKDDEVLITAASSSVGLAAIQIVKATGGMAIATTRGADKKSFLLKAGADHVIVTDEEDLVERGMSLTAGKGVRVVFDQIGRAHV
jgi:NADPH:quinone reductase-like Zn-dependent oxidoreductase